VDDATGILPVQALMMDTNRAVGSAKGIRGAVKEVVGKTVGDAKLESDGRPTR
jgi:uncharacterized protein YjbJ (UPF0337 family)